MFFVKELREKDLGVYSGTSYSHVKDLDEFNELIKKIDKDKSVETKKSVEIRVGKLLDSVFKTYTNTNVLFLAHNGTNEILMRMILKESNLSSDNIKLQGNTAINIFEINEDKNHKIHILNCTKHLD